MLTFKSSPRETRKRPLNALINVFDCHTLAAATRRECGQFPRELAMTRVLDVLLWTVVSAFFFALFCSTPCCFAYLSGFALWCLAQNHGHPNPGRSVSEGGRHRHASTEHKVISSRGGGISGSGTDFFPGPGLREGV